MARNGELSEHSKGERAGSFTYADSRDRGDSL